MEELQILVEDDFLDIFDHLIDNQKLENGNLNLFSIKIKNNEFDYNILIDELVNRLVSFCTSYKQFEYQKYNNKIGALAKESRKLFREYTNVKRQGEEYTNNTTTDGEVGELLLYSFLESHLNAPKLLTKMRFKTSTHDAVKRSDGIHLLKVDDEYFELIYGESKLYKDLNGGIKEAFKSIHEFKSRDNNNIHDEQTFLINNIETEFTESQYQRVKSILIPSEEDIDYDISFGIFVGFEIDIPLDFKEKSMRAFREELKILIKNEVIGKVNYINKKVIEYGLQNHNFYIYITPFTNLSKTKVSIIEGILE